MNNLSLLAHVVFFDGKPAVSYTVRIVKDKKETIQVLGNGRECLDADLIKLVKEWEAVGIEVRASRYKDGVWTGPKPFKWFNRFKRK